MHRRYVSLTLCSVLLSGCANFTAGNLFSHYSAQNKDLYQSVAAGNYTEATDNLDDFVAGDVLDNLEKGRVYFLDAQYPQSFSAFEKSDQAVKEQQDEATISLSRSANSVGSLAINDNLKEYIAPDYELGFLHLYLGLNYLQQQKLEDALVEMRRANQVQEAARKSREAELDNAQQQLEDEGVSPNIGAVLAHYPDAGKKLSAVQNGYLFFLSGLLYETSHDLNDAYVDYRRALAVAPNNQAVIEASIRVAKALAMNEDLRMLKKRYGDMPSLNTGQGRVILIDEQGIVDALDGWQLTLPLYDSRGQLALYSVALPYYPSHAHHGKADLVLNQKVVLGSRLADVNNMAKQDLTERMPTLVVRQVLRVIAKDELRKNTTQGNDIGSLVFNIWNTLTEQPDTRSWLTLPAQVNAMSQLVSAGEQTLQVGQKSYTFNVPSGGTTLVWLSRQGDNATIWHKQLGKL
ncbi:COG3014 family protein [Vibrio tritonius]|uniref:COG3014 family protein n=1 Tax=Vibrio tritonius TaxID=1435069 RepID=UPI000838C32B|nr:hypothetical protein [Vibrio tritonius]